MKPEDVQVIALFFEGWMFGLMTCWLTSTIRDYVEIKRRNRRHQVLLDAGVDPLDILLGEKL